MLDIFIKIFFLIKFFFRYLLKCVDRGLGFVGLGEVGIKVRIKYIFCL